MAPHSPQAPGSAPAKPWRSSILRFLHGRFADAWRVHAGPSKLTFESARKNELRRLDLAMVENVLLAFVYVERGNMVRAISLRRASRAERRMHEKEIWKESH